MASRPGSGDGFIRVADGGVRWGIYGAAGMLVRHVDAEGTVWFFLARRSMYCHRGGTWAIPGGALDEGEDPLTGALREFEEEIGARPDPFEVARVHEDDHGGWSYWTILVDVPVKFPEPKALSWETDEVGWFASHEIAALPLFDAFEATVAHLQLTQR